jgi:O-antigen ligase
MFAILSPALLALSLLLAVLIGPHQHDWTWGPAAFSLGLALVAAIPLLGRHKEGASGALALTLPVLAVVWLIGRAWVSPVKEYAVADSFLVVMCAAAFLVARVALTDRRANAVLVYGIVLVALANLVVTIIQFRHPGFLPLCNAPQGFGSKTGFFPQYNEAANFLIAVSMVGAAHAVLGGQGSWSRSLFGIVGFVSLGFMALTYSRGGILGAVVAALVFGTLVLVVGRKRKASWFGPVSIVIPLVLVLALGGLTWGWAQSQEARGGLSGIDRVLDNDVRLYMAGVALSCIALHPFIGGGSRSYSWECFRFWDNDAYGPGGARPDLVHNEFLQLATDYGLVGALLVCAALAFLAVFALVRVWESRDDNADSRNREAWQVGALAALAGMLVQSCFSFVFHLVPGVLLLGICLGALAPPREALSAKPWRRWWVFAVLPLSFIPGFGLLTGGYDCTRIAPSLWRVYLSKQEEVPAEESAAILADVLRVRPSAELHRERAVALCATEDPPGDPAFAETAREAIAEYDQAIALHPWEPSAWADSAELISLTSTGEDPGRDAEAERRFREAIRLQGGMEACFQSRQLYSLHLLHKGLRLSKTNLSAALPVLEESVKEFDKAMSESSGIGTKWQWRPPLHEALGAAREQSGDRTGALEAYDTAAAFSGGNRAHYRAGVLMAKMARDDWAERRPERAMAGFIRARARIYQAGPSPEGIDPALLKEQLAYIDNSIALLRRAGIRPEE